MVTQEKAEELAQKYLQQYLNECGLDKTSDVVVHAAGKDQHPPQHLQHGSSVTSYRRTPSVRLTTTALANI